MIHLKKIDPGKLSEEVVEFGPIECMKCRFDGHIPKSFYLVESKIDNEDDYKELCRTVKKELGYESFSEASCESGYLITVCRCPKCGSEEIFEDF